MDRHDAHPPQNPDPRRLMRIFRNWRDLPDDARGATVALGNFDGVHLGHASVMPRRPCGPARRAAGGADLRAASARTFPPGRPALPPDPVGRTGRRAWPPSACALLYELPFDHDVQPDAGRGLRRRRAARRPRRPPSGLRAGFRLRPPPRRRRRFPRRPRRSAGHGPDPRRRRWPTRGGPLSSTRIRRALQDGYPERATAELGRPWAIRGLVAHGDKRGRTIGFPTANVALGRHLEPARGVYAVTVALADGSTHPRRRQYRPPPDRQRRAGKPAGGQPVRLRRRPLRRGIT